MLFYLGVVFIIPHFPKECNPTKPLFCEYSAKSAYEKNDFTIIK